MSAILFETEDNPVPANASAGYFDTHDGLALRYAIFRAPAGPTRGTVVILQGRSESIERYFEVIRELNARGLWVATFDLRGQGGSPRMLRNKTHGHLRHFSDYERDLDAFIEQIVLPDCRLPFFLLAHSTGGLIALSAAPYLSNRIDRMVLSAPFVGLTGQTFSETTIRRIATLACALGLGSFPLSRQRASSFADNPLTSDEGRFARNRAITERYPDLSLGAPTARWLRECLRTIDRVTRPEHLFSITVPTVVIAPTRDGVVPYLAQERMARYFRAGQLVPITGARHEILQERDIYRAAALAAFHAFIPGSDAEQDDAREPLGV